MINTRGRYNILVRNQINCISAGPPALLKVRSFNRLDISKEYVDYYVWRCVCICTNMRIVSSLCLSIFFNVKQFLYHSRRIGR